MHSDSGGGPLCTLQKPTQRKMLPERHPLPVLLTFKRVWTTYRFIDKNVKLRGNTSQKTRVSY